VCEVASHLNVHIVTMKQIASNALVNIVNCFRVIFNLVTAQDTLEKEIVNDELIVSILDVKATLTMYLSRTKLSLLLPKLMKYMK